MDGIPCLMLTNYEKSPNHHILQHMLTVLSKPLIEEKSKYKADPSFLEWYQMVLSYDFAHAECDYTHEPGDYNKSGADYSKMKEWVLDLAEYSWKKSNEKTRKKMLRRFKKDPASVNQWGSVSDYLFDFMIDLGT